MGLHGPGAAGAMDPQRCLGLGEMAQQDLGWGAISKLGEVGAQWRERLREEGVVLMLEF